MLKRTPIRKKRKGVRRGHLTKEQKAVVRHRIYLRSRGRCELNILPGCIRGVLPEDGLSPWDHWHLVHMRSVGSGGTWDDENLKGGCHVCHLHGLHNAMGKPCPVKPEELRR